MIRADASLKSTSAARASWYRYRWFAVLCLYGVLFYSLQLKTDRSITSQLWQEPAQRHLQGVPQRQPPDTPRPVHVLFCLHGGSNSFLDEWEVSLKSVVLNAPLDVPLHVHIIANQAAHDAVQRRLNKHSLIDSAWRQPVTITSYNVEDRREEFQLILEKALRGHAMDERVSLGGYYRLLAPRILPHDIGPMLYMDVDTVLLSNLQELWKHVDPRYAFQSSKQWLCSAFMIINLPKAAHFWDLLQDIPTLDSGGDQVLLNSVVQAHPNLLGALPPAWDTHLGHGFRRQPHEVLEKRPDGVGMLHFNGPRPNFFSQGLMLYCDRTADCKGNDKNKAIFEQTWMLADYYVKLPWQWAKYMGQSKIVPEEIGYRLTYKEVVSNSTLPAEQLVQMRRKAERQEHLKQQALLHRFAVKRGDDLELVQLAKTADKAERVQLIQDATVRKQQEDIINSTIANNNTTASFKGSMNQQQSESQVGIVAPDSLHKGGQGVRHEKSAAEEEPESERKELPSSMAEDRKAAVQKVMERIRTFKQVQAQRKGKEHRHP